MVPILDDVTCMVTIPDDMEVEAHFLAKEDGIIVGIALEETLFNEVEPSLNVLRPEFKKSAESGTTLLIHNRIRPNHVDTDTRYETGIELVETR